MRTSAIIFYILTLVTFLGGVICIMYGINGLLSIQGNNSTDIFTALFTLIGEIGTGITMIAYFIVIGGILILLSIFFLITAIILTAIGDNKQPLPYHYFEEMVKQGEDNETAFRECIKHYTDKECVQAKSDYEITHKPKVVKA